MKRGTRAMRHASSSVCVPSVLATDRKSTRLNSSHLVISYAVFCLKKKTHTMTLALGYRPQLVLLHHASLSEQEVLSLSQRLCAEPALYTTQLVVQLQDLQCPSAQELAQLGVTVAAGSSPSSSSSQNIPNPTSGRATESRPLLQMLRRMLLPVSPRHSTRRPGV